MTATLGRAIVVWWHDIDRWVVPSAAILSRRLPAGWVGARVGDVVKLVSDSVKVQAATEYRMAGVRWYGEGVFHRETVRGDLLSARWVRPLVPGALIYNRLFAWKASFAVVRPDLADCHVSNEFPQFVPDGARLLPEYLYLWCITDQTINAVNAASTGSAAVSRNRFREEYFLDFEIPLPPLPVQRKVVAAWGSVRKATAAAQAKIEQLERDIEARFLGDLGLKAPAQATLPKVFAVSWRDFLRWSVSYNQHAQVGADIRRGKYPVVSLGSCLDLVQYGTSEKANSAGRGTPVLRINNIKGRTIDTADLKHVELPAKVRCGLLLLDGDILVIRTSGSRDLVGTCAAFHENGEYVFASYLIRLRPNAAKATPDYIVWFLNSSLGRQQVDATSRQIMQNNINGEELRALQIPLPPLSLQHAMMKRVDAGRAKIAKLKAEAKTIADTSKADVEAMILGTKLVE
jgi:type I restriction enzyme, S subunit